MVQGEGRERGDRFELYDLTVVVEAIEGHCTCQMRVGDAFHLRGGKLSLPDGADFCLYALQAVIPLLPARQRRNHPADWIETDTRASCPDPACRLIMRIDRVATRTLRHDDVSPIPWDSLERKGTEQSGQRTAAHSSPLAPPTDDQAS